MSGFFDDDFIKSQTDEIEKKESELKGDTREKMSAGIHDLFLCKIETDTGKGDVPLVKLIYNKDTDQKTFRDLPKYFRFDESEPEKFVMNKKMFLEHFYKGFGYTFKAGDLKSVIQQIKKFEGKKLRAAIRIKQRIMKSYVKDAEGNNTSDLRGIMIIDQADIYYVGSVDKEMSLKEEKKFVKISTSELEEYADHKNEHPDRYDENGRLVFEKSEDAAAVEEAVHATDDATIPAEKPKPSETASSVVDELPW